jgi:cystathionine beta-synthase
MAAAPEGPTKCKWSLSNPGQKSPHASFPPKKCEGIMDTILDNIGNTPMVRLNKIPQSFGVKCEVVAKCDFFNAGGSVKDRIGKRMIEDAERSGRIKKGDVLIEPTSGNTGIGLALAAALKGYRMIITLPEKMSTEKVDVLKGLGAEIIRTPTEAAFDSPDSHIGVAARLNKEIPNSHILDQYSNPSNPLAHYDGTAEEMLKQCDGKIDAVVIAAGTGGTITGIARKLKERLPNVVVYGVDPHGSILAQPASLNGAITSYKVEGIGYDFIPIVLDRPLVDKWIKTEDKESLLMARRLIREEGLLVGGSSGAAMTAAIQVAKTMKEGQRLVVLFADSVRNYMSKFLNEGWMVDNGFMEPSNNEHEGKWWSKMTVASLNLRQPFTISPKMTCKEAVEILTSQGYDQLPVVDDNGIVMGMVTMGNLSAKLLSSRVQSSDPVSCALYTQFKTIAPTVSLSDLSRIFERDYFALVCVSAHHHVSASKKEEKKIIFGIATRIDLLNFLVAKNPNGPNGASCPPSKL